MDMKFKLSHLCLVACCVALVVSVGCKKNTGSRDGLVPAAGVVMYNGQPVADAEIEMRPVSEDQLNSVAVGRTDAEGKFTACVFVNFPPKAGKFAGYSDRVGLKWTGTKFEQGEMD